jgi:uncharacterized lipoprotein YddW (UPF0748 family)
MRKVRGVWLTNVDSDIFDSQSNITKAINLLATTGFNVVFPVVWNKGFTLFKSQVMKDNFGAGFEIDPKYKPENRDPLQEIIDAAKHVGIKVIPWFEFGFAFSHTSIVSSEKDEFKNLLHSKGWIDKDKLLIDNGFEWMNALNSDVQQFMLDLILEVATKYDVDGIQGDDRLPAFPVQFLAPTQSKASARNNLTTFLKNLHDGVKAIETTKGKELLVSMAPHPRQFGFDNYLQDTKTWIELDLVNIIHPQLYRHISDDKPEMFEAYKGLIVTEISGLNDEEKAKISPGILMKFGDFLISPTNLQKVTKHNDKNFKIAGAVFFFFEGLRKNDRKLAKTLRNDIYALNSLGDEGPDVRKIQSLLKGADFYTNPITGVFDKNTEDAVKAFQTSQGFSSKDIDGIVGEQTLAALSIDSLVAFGDMAVPKSDGITA